MDDLLNTSTIVITSAMLKTIAEIDEFKGAWVALGRLAPDRLSSLRRVATIESVGSSTRIEGARLTNTQVDRMLTNLDITALASRDEQEVAGYATAMELVFDHAEQISLTENHIKQLHQTLLQHVNKDERHRGEYKKFTNHVEAFGPDGESLGVVFETAAPFETQALMQNLIAWMRMALGHEDHQGDLASLQDNPFHAGEDSACHPLMAIGVFVVVFLAIHPFQDGNGRLSRILTTLLLLQSGYSYVPYASLESIIENTKDGYYRALRRTQQTLRSGKVDWQPWLKYFLGALHSQKRMLEEKIKREKIHLDSLPPLALEILDIARTQGRVSVAVATKITNASRNTVKSHLKTLVSTGNLIRHGAGRGTWYSLA